MVWTGLVHGLSCFATDFAERRDANFKGEFVAKYVPESTVSVETGRRKAGAEKSLLIPSTPKNVFLKVVAAFEMLDSPGFMAPFPNTRSGDVV